MNHTLKEDNSSLLNPSEQVIATEFDEGDGVLVDLNRKQYYQLNETAMLIWRSLEEGRTNDEIICRITNEYEVSVEHAAKSVQLVLDNLRRHELIR